MKQSLTHPLLELLDMCTEVWWKYIHIIVSEILIIIQILYLILPLFLISKSNLFFFPNALILLTYPDFKQPNSLIKRINTLETHNRNITLHILLQLQTSTETRFKTLYNDARKEHNISNLIKQVENGKHVFIDWKMRLQYIMKRQYLETDRCNLALG